ATRPRMNAPRQAVSLGLGRSSPETMPVIPAIRPLTRMNRATARPITRPPVRAEYGVNWSQAMCIGESSNSITSKILEYYNVIINSASAECGGRSFTWVVQTGGGPFLGLYWQ